MTTGICAVALLPFKRRQIKQNNVAFAAGAKCQGIGAVRRGQNLKIFGAEPRLDQLEIGDEIVDDQNQCGHAMGVPAFLHALNTSRSRQIICVTIAH
jgi:hypothetical protein